MNVVFVVDFIACPFHNLFRHSLSVTRQTDRFVPPHTAKKKCEKYTLRPNGITYQISYALNRGHCREEGGDGVFSPTVIEVK